MFQRYYAFVTKLRRCPLEGSDSHRVIERIVQPAQTSRLRFDRQVRPYQPQVVALARSEHHAVFAEPDWLRVTIDGGVAYCDNGHQLPARKEFKDSVTWLASALEDQS